MNRFRCTIASGGEGLTITVTCDSAFAGATITATDGTTTLTKTCPSSSPYEVVFNLPNGGTWTISSGNDSVTVYFGDSVDLHHIPTGSSATPINDIQTWLHCANIWDKSYTTISQVLADGTTVTALIASNNAADYMARSTTWASSVVADSSAMTKIGANDYCADALLADSTWRTAICNSTYFESVLNVKVPTMTSNTTPSGVASASSVSGNNQAYYAFANNGQWTASSTSNQWVQYKFTSSTKVNMIALHPGHSYDSQPSTRIKNFKIQASNDGTTFTDLYSGVASQLANINAEPQKFDFSNNNYYIYYRLLGIDIYSSDNVGVKSLQFYGRA